MRSVPSIGLYVLIAEMVDSQAVFLWLQVRDKSHCGTKPI